VNNAQFFKKYGNCAVQDHNFLQFLIQHTKTSQTLWQHSTMLAKVLAWLHVRYYLTLYWYYFKQTIFSY